MAATRPGSGVMLGGFVATVRVVLPDVVGDAVDGDGGMDMAAGGGGEEES